MGVRIQNFVIPGVSGLLAAGLVLTTPAPGRASHEPFGVYEDWSNPNGTIRSDRWRGSEEGVGQEIVRRVRNFHLNMGYRKEGATDLGNDGATFGANALAASNPTAIDQLAAQVKVKSVTAAGCAANPDATRARGIRLEIVKFNDGSSTGPGDRTGDFMGRVQALRDSDSPDAPDVLRAVGSVHRCEDADCIQRSRKGTAQLGTVRLEQRFTLRVIWDQPNHRFLFGLNNDPDKAEAYSESDTAPAVGPAATLEIRHTPVNCTAGAVVTEATSRVYDVETNTSAIIP